MCIHIHMHYVSQREREINASYRRAEKKNANSLRETEKARETRNEQGKIEGADDTNRSYLDSSKAGGKPSERPCDEVLFPVEKMRKTTEGCKCNKIKGKKM